MPPIVLASVAMTTLGVYLIVRRFPDINIGSLRLVMEIVVESIGAALLFLAANVALGITLVLLLRSFTATFFSLYAAGDFLVMVLSAFQGLVFQVWWRLNHRLQLGECRPSIDGAVR